MPNHDLIAIGASAGGVETLGALFKHLPADLPAAVLVVMHLSPNSPGIIARVLGRDGSLPTSMAVHGEPIVPGHIYVAPADLHLLVEGDHLALVHGPHENRSRPAIDPLFRSVALAYGSRAIGVILTGALDDGGAGLAAIKRCGGIAIVQDPRDALVKGMPTNALRAVDPDHVVASAELPALLARLTAEPAGPSQPAPKGLSSELDSASLHLGDATDGLSKHGEPSAFTCPACNGALWELGDGELLRYRCHVGHAFSEVSLRQRQEKTVESALWIAVRALHEQATLFERMASRADGRDQAELAQRYRETRTDREAASETLREMLRLWRLDHRVNDG